MSNSLLNTNTNTSTNTNTNTNTINPNLIAPNDYCDLIIETNLSGHPKQIYLLNIKISDELSIDKILRRPSSLTNQWIEKYKLGQSVLIYLENSKTLVCPTYVPRKFHTFRIANF